jgi:hypothetical protein
MTTVVQRKDLLALGFLVLITVIVRVPGVFNRAIWYDEAITLLETAGNAIPAWSELPTPARTQKELLEGSPSLGEVAAGLRETDVHPPVYYGLLSKWRRIVGGSIEAARFFSVLCSIASVILLYLLLRSARFERPLVPSLVYTLSSGAVHYAQEARNYALAMSFLLVASFLAYLSTKSEFNSKKFFWLLSTAIGVSCGLAFQTNYLAIFPAVFLLSWFVIWSPKPRMLRTFPAIISSLAISVAGVATLSAQLGARPRQFQRELGFWRELLKIFNFNIEMLWTPTVSNKFFVIVVFAILVLLAAISFLYIKNSWRNIDKKLFTMMTGLAVAPSLGLLALDLVFSKNLGKSSYVLFAGPAFAYLLTLAIGHPPELAVDTSRWPAKRLASVLRYVLPIYIGLQLTGINFDLERTPGFAGSTLRSLARRIEASSAAPVVVIGAGHGRGDPATVIYELAPETMVCVIDNDTDLSRLSSELASFDDIWMVFAKGRVTATIEQSLFEDLTKGDTYHVVSQAKRVAHLTKTRRVSASG